MFPKAEVETTLKEWYERKTRSPFRREESGTVFDLQPEIASIETIEVFLEIQPLIDFELKKKSNLIKPGGYNSCEELIKDMLPKLERRFNEFHKIEIEVSPKVTGGERANVNY